MERYQRKQRERREYQIEYHREYRKEYYLKNSSSFLQQDKKGNFRLFYYLNSPFKYPKFVISLINKSLIFKSMIAEYSDYYQIYCLIKNINPKDYDKVVKSQNFHSWSAIFWYKNSNAQGQNRLTNKTRCD